MRLTVMRLGLKFQFHKGTIKTGVDMTAAPAEGHFNSIKVRLKQSKQKRRKRENQFQFHKGTIKTQEVRIQGR